MTFLYLFLQEIISENQNEEHVESLVDLILKGGWTMLPLFLLSIIAIYIFVERILTIRAASKRPKKFIEDVKRYVVEGQVDKALALCKELNTPVARMIEKGISRIGSPLNTIETSIENVGKLEINELERNLSSLATIAGAGPMIGFLGTVLGMIDAFRVIANQTNPATSDMASGIYEAMITTAGGLIVGLIAYVAYNYCTSQIQKIIRRMEHSSIEFIDLLQEPQK